MIVSQYACIWSCCVIRNVWTWRHLKWSQWWIVRLSACFLVNSELCSLVLISVLIKINCNRYSNCILGSSRSLTHSVNFPDIQLPLYLLNLSRRKLQSCQKLIWFQPLNFHLSLKTIFHLPISCIHRMATITNQLYLLSTYSIQHISSKTVKTNFNWYFATTSAPQHMFLPFSPLHPADRRSRYSCWCCCCKERAQ